MDGVTFFKIYRELLESFLTLQLGNITVDF